MMNVNSQTPIWLSNCKPPKIASPHLPGISLKKLPILIASRDWHKPGTFVAVTVDLYSLLGTVLASVHLVGQTEVAESLAASAGHRFTNVIARTGLGLNDDGFNAFPGKEQCSGRTTLARRLLLERQFS